ncbi:MAG: hypothetical protein COX79_00510 [Candidatus Levybacteria bacterium CG_4_10_14_0_2_um_filter_36_16]|nr:MAG: hypothetical protein AUK12_03505 [Candidatus Levybacteria bacterium CG2_30_37_29]PIZ97891.1 MAG: hypothetical protein COX79_00510 [Candidatus Levybacteria bacterium CG_4_10_14_0_2_um_filter_36_16]
MKHKHKEKTNRILIAIAILVALVVLIAPKPEQQTTTNNNTALPIKKVVISQTVNLTSKGFAPQTVTIKVGESVRWTNKSSAKASVNSADHPSHKLFPFLNLGLFNPGSTVQARFNSAGTFTYHNHFAPTQTGTVIVK